MRLGISLSTDFRAFSSFRRETCESTSLSALIFVPFQEQEKVWRGLFSENYNHVWPGIIVRCVVLFLSFFSYRALSFQKEKREGLARDSLVKITTILLPGVWAGLARDQHCNTSSASGSVGGRACALCKAVSKEVTCKRKEDKVRFRFVGYSIFASAKDSVPRQRGCAKDRSVRPGIFVRSVVFFFDTVRCLLKKEREKVWQGTPWWKLQPYYCWGFGRAKPVISVETPPPPPAPSAVGLAPSARQ